METPVILSLFCSYPHILQDITRPEMAWESTRRIFDSLSSSLTLPASVQSDRSRAAVRCMALSFAIRILLLLWQIEIYYSSTSQIRQFHKNIAVS